MPIHKCPRAPAEEQTPVRRRQRANSDANKQLLRKQTPMSEYQEANADLQMATNKCQPAVPVSKRKSTSQRLRAEPMSQCTSSEQPATNIEHRATSSEQERATSSEQRATSSEQRATSGEQRATSNEQGNKQQGKNLFIKSSKRNGTNSLIRVAISRAPRTAGSE